MTGGLIKLPLGIPVLARQTCIDYAELGRLQDAPTVSYRGYLSSTTQIVAAIVGQSTFLWALALIIHERYAAP